MGKMANWAIFLICLQVCLIMFEGQSPEHTALWQIVINPFSWNALIFFGAVSALALAIGGGAIFFGSVAGLKTDFMVFSGMIPAVISMSIPVANLSGVIGKYTSSFFCGGIIWTSCAPSIILTIITGGILSIYTIMTIIDFWRGKD